MITVYPQDCTDFSTNGLGALTPISALAYGQDGHFTELEVVQPVDSTNRWALLARGALLKADVPVRESPFYENTETITRGTTVTVQRLIYKVRVNTRLRLRSGPGTSYKILASYKNGTKVVKLSESGGWYRVALVDGGRVGWMSKNYLNYDSTKTEKITQQQVIGSRVVQHRQSGEQLYRIYQVEADTAKGTVTAKAQHIFYDLRYNIVNGTFAPEKEACGSALQRFWNHLMVVPEHALHILDGLTTKISGDYTWKNPIEALLDLDEGIIPQGHAKIVLDNWDIWVMPDDTRASGVTIRRGKNLKGVQPTENSADVVTRIVPAGKAADGGRLYITDGTGLNGMCVDSTHINDYPQIHYHFQEYDVRIVDRDPDNETTFTSVSSARAKLKSLAQAEFSENGIDLPSYGLTVDFILLENSDESEQYAGLQSVYLNDTVTVVDEMIGLTAAVRVTGFTYNCLSGQYETLELGDVESVEQTVCSYNLPTGGVSGSKIATGSLSGAALRSLSVEYAKFSAAAIAQLSADSITALTAHISEMVAGTATIDDLYADLATIATAQITTAHINSANIDWASVTALMADSLDAIVAHIESLDAETIETDALYTTLAGIADARIEDATIAQAHIDQLEAVIANIISVAAQAGDFGFANIQELVAEAMVLSRGAAGTVGIENLLVTSANLLNCTVGELVLKGSDDKYYVVNIDSEGAIYATETTVTAGEIAAGQTSAGRQIVDTDMNIANLNATTLTAQAAAIGSIVTAALTAEKITAGQALLASATIPTLYTTAINAIGASLDISANQSIRMLVGDIDGLTIGGRNLILGTLDPQTDAADRPHIKGQTSNTSGRGTCTVSEHGIRMTTTSANWAYIYFGASSNSSESLQGVRPGETYTFHADCAWKVLSGDDSDTTHDMVFRAYARREGQSFREIDADYISQIPREAKGTEMTGHTQLTFTVPDDAIAFFMGISCSNHTAALYAAGDYVELSNIKFETGNRATAWTPAPEDMETAIAAADTRAQAAEEVLRGSVESFAEDVSALSLEMNRTKGTIEGLVRKDDLSAYIRYGVTAGGDGTLELGQANSSYVARVSPENGFQVIYDGTEMSRMKKNTIAAPVMQPGRMIQIGDNVVKISSDGGLLFN